jgi:hypothetical protein
VEPWVDTAENQKAWTDVILCRIGEFGDHYLALRDSLHKEFGAAVVATSARAGEFDEKLRTDLKAKAEAPRV